MPTYEARLFEGLEAEFNRMQLGIEQASEDAAFAQMTANQALGLVVREGEDVAKALSEAASNGGGAVRMAAGRHRIDSELFLGDGVSLVGQGSATVLEVPSSLTYTLPSVVNTGSSAGASVRGLRIACNGKADVGLYSSPAAGTSYGDFSPDPCFRANDLFIDDARITGVYMGGQARSTHLQAIRVRRAGGWAYWLRNPDSWFVDLEGTTAGTYATTNDLYEYDGLKLGMLSGVYIGTVNSVFRGCKAWYTRGYGFHVRGSRNRISECESQDTCSHGWRIEYDRNVFTNCVADTASMYDVGGTPKGADGFYIDGNGSSVYMGLYAFDRRPGGKPAQQRYGFNIQKALLDSGRFVGYGGFDNVSGLMYARP